MRLLFGLFFILVCWVSHYEAPAQSIELYGKVLNRETKESIPFANIAIKDIYKGTASNALGEFSFKVDSLPLNLVITHLSYESLEIRVDSDDELVIELEPGKLLMDELVIKGAGSKKFAYDLVRKAYYKVIGKGRNQRYGKAFYRQISKNGDDYSELYEIFYDTRYSNNGVDDWAIQEGRYALKLSTVDSFIYNKNFTHMVRLLTVVQPKTEDLIMPLSEMVMEQFDLTTERILSVNNRNVAQISFKKRDGISFPALEGEIHIDTESHDVLKLIGDIRDDNLNFITLTGESSSWKNYVVHCEIVFKPLNEEQLALDYMRLQQNFDYYVDDVFANKVETKSFFTYYEYYEPPKRKKLGGRLIRFNQRDSDVLDAVGYNQLFWDENIVVKRTPVEAEVIESFERERAFGSIYLNDKNQLILEDYEIDNDPFIVHVRQKLKEYELPRNGEKIYVHTDKPAYVTGEDLWFKAYVVNMSTNSPATASQTLHLDIYTPSGELLQHQLFEISDGKSSGAIRISEDWSSGEYRVVGYTDWMRNFDEKYYYEEDLLIINHDDESGMMSRSVIDSANRFKMYPEGGNLIDNMPAQVGFVALNKFGRSVDVRGRLLNNIGRQVSPIKSQFKGFGSVFMLPRSDITYSTMFMSDEFEADPFPAVVSSGYTVMINNLKPNTIDITVRGTPDLEGKKVYLLVISKGVLFDRRIGMLTRGLYKSEVPKSNIPSGISQILLVDELGNIVNRRYVYLNQPEATTVKYYLPKKEFRPGERIDMVIEINDENGKNVGFSNFSISVLDKDKISRTQEDRSIKSYLDFEYALDYKIEEVGSLFMDFERETLKDFDYIMLSQQSILPELVSFKDGGEMPKGHTARRYDDIVISGKVTLQNQSQALSNGYLTFVDRSSPDLAAWYIRSDDLGRFRFDGYNGLDSNKLTLIAKNAEGEEVSASIILDSFADTRLAKRLSTTTVEIDGDLKNYHSEMQTSINETSNFFSVGFAQKSYEQTNSKTSLFTRADQSIVLDRKYEQFSTLGQLLKSRLPGTNVDDGQIRIRGKDKGPLILMDGVIINLEALTDRGNQPRIANRYASIPVDQLASIEIIRNASPNALFGESWDHGIIAIYSKLDYSILQNYESELLTEVALPGYQRVENPWKLDRLSDAGKDGPDNRSTIYWNPDITTNRKGRAKVSFYNSKQARNFQICVEGITKDGIPIFDLYDFGRNYRSKRNP